MPNNIDSKCKLCRRAGEKLFLKGDRCMSPKCAMVRRPYAPGVHGHNPSRGGSEFGRQLAMKQKIKRLYGVMERQFRHHFDEVRNIPGITGDQLLSRLERRLDNVVYRLGFAASRAQAKQLVSHKMFSVNGVRMNISSYEIHVGDLITLKTNKKAKVFFKNQEESLKAKKDVPHWLSLDAENQTGKVVSMPTHEDVGVRVDAQMVVEYYSK
ncbi:MAG: 30S ribosomal protein S4 [Candidatus Moranbacteria bacterium]|nr:30S ribosomal protein S4 [Candidatus Moranbacteria bacterium]OIQ04050.1 MAG: 30S ribosomal protein S4 [Candidatus Moranbacteria bacterium CG2_30_41_165]PIP25257.1 MAG: 30S ribosomal protein S4 [Candidatus Moranbacteria bacterium CG23_combo_of_CG06-09_8_20_14_all_41_28]PIV86124.1 MAG: 30S ribosomal protein S4 [Candidatus Moranbacteria bacterium CG17_big_fil_post_rev_8_21_14_2_50_41_107]PIW94476.1 MAG: 30S ribosomal protein S4 [Candidatus Moranbacteria bacterium CG_4_8_14_3_um_filter_41_13]PI